MTQDRLATLVDMRPRISADMVGSDQQQLATRTRIMAESARPAVRSSRRQIALVGVAAAVVVTALAAPVPLPTSSPGGATPAAAAELLQLSRAARSSSDAPLRTGQFRHVTVTASQVSPQLQTTMDTWTGNDGRGWQRTVVKYADGSPTRTETYLIPKPDVDTAQLPADPDQLETYLKEHASGSSSKDEAVFSQLADLLRSPAVPAALRSAATEVLARTEHVELGARATDSYGRTVQEVRFVDELTRPGQSQVIVFDTADARYTAERITTLNQPPDRPRFQATVAPAVITEDVPADVMKDARPYGEDHTDPSQGG